MKRSKFLAAMFVVFIVSTAWGQAPIEIVVNVTADGQTDNAPAINNAIATAVSQNISNIRIPCGQIMVKAAINNTNTSSLTIRGCGANELFAGDPLDPLATVTNITEIMCNTGAVCWDATGSNVLHLQNLLLRSSQSYSNPSKVGLLFGRDNANPPPPPEQNQFCFSTNNVLDSVYVTMDSNPNATITGTIALYNVGAEAFTIRGGKYTADSPLVFDAINEYNIASSYVTLGTNCPASMTQVTIKEGAAFQPWSHAALSLNHTFDLQTDASTEWLNASHSRNWAFNFNNPPNGRIFLRGQVEGFDGVLNANSSFDHVDLDLLAVSPTMGLVTLANNGSTISASNFNISQVNGTTQPLFSSLCGRWTVTGSTLNLGSLSGNNNTLVSVIESVVLAPGLSDAAINFSPGSSYVLLDDSGMSFQGDLHVNGFLSKNGGAFRIDHPLDPANKYLTHSFVESPDMMNIYNGTVVLNSKGEADVKLPDYFQALNRDFRYQLTCVGKFAPVYVRREIVRNHFRIAGGTPGLKVSWQVTGIRKDPYAETHRVQPETPKPEAERGRYGYPSPHPTEK